MLIDTHAHLNFKQFNKDREEVIKRAFEGGVEKIMNIGTNLKTSKESIELAENHNNIYAAVSLHPIDVEKERFDENDWLGLAKHKRVVAIGETGLDFYHDSNKETQKEVFKKLIKLAREVEKPLIIHVRGASGREEEADRELLKVLTSEKLPSRKGVVHCFGKDYEVAERFLKLGFLISYTGNITYNKKRTSSIAKVPLDKMMIETDCPFMAPVPHRGERCEPSYVRQVAQKIAEVKGITFGKVAKATTKNAKNLFKI